MPGYNWSVYAREWYDWPPKKQGKFLIKELQLYGDPVALAWFPSGSLPPELEKYIYKGNLKLVHCQFVQRARFRGETYILDGVKNRPDPPDCEGDAYIGLTTVNERLMTGVSHTRTGLSSSETAKLGIFGNPVASRRSLRNSYWMVPPDIKHFAISPLSDCPFDPDVVTIIGNPRQITMACRALQYFTGKAVVSETGPGTCSASWIAAYLSGEAHYTLGCHGVFLAMGVAPTEICLSIPGEQMPTLCQALELWRRKGKAMFREAPPNEQREFVKAPYDGPGTGEDYQQADYIPWNQRLGIPRPEQ
ncbi:DUF169 domain-containing protein [Chloroflexota bacterium]